MKLTHFETLNQKDKFYWFQIVQCMQEHLNLYAQLDKSQFTSRLKLLPPGKVISIKSQGTWASPYPVPGDLSLSLHQFYQRSKRPNIELADMMTCVTDLSILRTTSTMEERMYPPVLNIIRILQTRLPACHWEEGGGQGNHKIWNFAK